MHLDPWAVAQSAPPAVCNGRFFSRSNLRKAAVCSIRYYLYKSCRNIVPKNICVVITGRVLIRKLKKGQDRFLKNLGCKKDQKDPRGGYIPSRSPPRGITLRHTSHGTSAIIPSNCVNLVSPITSIVDSINTYCYFSS